jgi:hypothetical protein
MSQTPPLESAGVPAAAPLRVMEAVGMGWRLLKSDFWRLWVLVLVFNLLVLAGVMVGQCLGIVPIIGACFSCLAGIAMSLFVQPALDAGLFYAIRQKIDGAEARLDNLFAAFRWRYWESVVGGLPALAIGLAIGMAMLALGGVGWLMVMRMAGGDPERVFSQWEAAPPYALIGVAALVFLALILVASILRLFLVFIFLAVWDFPGRYWDPIAASLRLVWAHFWSVLGLFVLFALIGLAAFLIAIIPGGAIAGAGALALKSWNEPPVTFVILLGIGGLFFALVSVFTACGIGVWFYGAVIHLYRAWRGQPLVQPVIFPWQASASGEAPAAPEADEPPGSAP